MTLPIFDYLISFFLLNPIGLAILAVAIIYAEYLTLASIARDQENIKLGRSIKNYFLSLKHKYYDTKYVSVSQVAHSGNRSKLHIIKVPIRQIHHRARKLRAAHR